VNPRNKYRPRVRVYQLFPRTCERIQSLLAEQRHHLNALTITLAGDMPDTYAPTCERIIASIEEELEMSKNGLGITRNLLEIRKQQDAERSSEFIKAGEKYHQGRLDAFVEHRVKLEQAIQLCQAELRTLDIVIAECNDILADAQTLNK
jgi:hypothetical protein